MLILKGFRFGMLLQLAVGPMCFLVFQTAASDGFLEAFSLVLAITLVDALYILLSGLGVAAIIDKKGVRKALKLFGGIVLIVFGLNILLGAFGVTLIPSIPFLSGEGQYGVFIEGLLLTASNPLTIIFWSGVFSAQIAEYKYSRKQLFFFGFGCVLSTITFLSVVSLLGTILNGFLPEIAMLILNAVVGALIIFFGVRMLFKKL